MVCPRVAIKLRLRVRHDSTIFQHGESAMGHTMLSQGNHGFIIPTTAIIAGPLRLWVSVLVFHPALTSAAAPSSPTDTCSSVYSDISSSSPLPSIHVVCNIPVIAPRPLPYHSPTFLQFDLPDADADLSHPPYTRGPLKRKRDVEDETAKPRDTKRPTTSNGYSTTHYASRSIRQSRGTRASQRSLRWW